MKEHLFSIEKRTKSFVWTLAILSLFSVVSFLILIQNEKTTSASNSNKIEKPNPFQNIELEAKSAFIFDLVNKRVLFSKNASEPLPLASLTKVMTAVTTRESVKGDKDIIITPDYLTPDGDSGLVPGERWKVSDLLDFTLLTSSNDGAKALAAASAISVFGTGANGKEEKLFVSLMNDEATKIGLLNTRFFNEHGLDRSAEKGGAYGSAEDMAKLFEYALINHSDLLDATKYDVLGFLSSQKAYMAENTNKFVDRIPNMIASKTGFTDLAGGNLVIAFDPGLNRPIVVSVLGSSEEGRFSDVLKLVEATMQSIELESSVNKN